MRAWGSCGCRTSSGRHFDDRYAQVGAGLLCAAGRALTRSYWLVVWLSGDLWHWLRGLGSGDLCSVGRALPISPTALWMVRLSMSWTRPTARWWISFRVLWQGERLAPCSNDSAVCRPNLRHLCSLIDRSVAAQQTQKNVLPQDIGCLAFLRAGKLAVTLSLYCLACFAWRSRHSFVVCARGTPLPPGSAPVLWKEKSRGLPLAFAAHGRHYGRDICDLIHGHCRVPFLGGPTSFISILAVPCTVLQCRPCSWHIGRHTVRDFFRSSFYGTPRGTMCSMAQTGEVRGAAIRPPRIDPPWVEAGPARLELFLAGAWDVEFSSGDGRFIPIGAPGSSTTTRTTFNMARGHHGALAESSRCAPFSHQAIWVWSRGSEAHRTSGMQNAATSTHPAKPSHAECDEA